MAAHLPQGELYSHVTGYYSFIYGPGGGPESAENALLSGQSDKLFYRRVSDMLTGHKQAGASLELTIDPKAQAAASKAMQGQQGAVVALDPTTGAILAMVSNPVRPEVLTSHDSKKVEKAWTSLNSDPTRPLVNRAIGGNLYPPGSVFKIVTAAEALASGKYTEESVLPDPRPSTFRRRPPTCRTATACRAARTTR